MVVDFYDFDVNKATQYEKMSKFKECLQVLDVLIDFDDFNPFFDNDELLNEINLFLNRCFKGEEEVEDE